MKRKKFYVVLGVCMATLVGCAPTDTSKVDVNDVTITRTDELIDFSDYMEAEESEDNEEKELTCVWDKKKLEDTKTQLHKNYYANFSQTSTSGLSNTEDIYAVLNKYEVWLDITNQDYKITNTSSSDSKVATDTYVFKDDKLYKYDLKKSTYVATDENPNLLNGIDITQIEDDWVLFELLCKDIIPENQTAGVVDKDGYEHYVSSSDEVNTDFISPTWNDYTQLKSQEIEFVYNPKTNTPVSVSITINYIKDENSCYTKTQLDFTSLAFNGSIALK